MLTVPEYFQKYIDSSVDLNVQHKICCPFHSESTPSFSYKPETGEWRCFGQCNIGGNDAFSLHKANKKFNTMEEAIVDLCHLEGIYDATEIDEVRKERQKAVSDRQIDLSEKILKLDYYLKNKNIEETLKVLQDLSVYR